MLNFCKKIGRYLFYIIFVGSFLWISSQLFWEKQTNVFLSSVTDYFQRQSSVDTQLSYLRVVYPDEPNSLEPTFNSPTVRQRINNIYEPLVKTDRDLKIQPALAISWGLLDQKTWDFRLRPDVVFHDGSSFGVEDVVGSINRALNYENSHLASLLSSIDSIEIVDDLRFKIRTHFPDPLLLQRLSSVLIFPAEYQYQTGEFLPVGTGSYKFVEWEKGDKILLERFEDYWGASSKFEFVEMISRFNKNERVMMFLNGDADFLAFVPFDAVEAIEERNFNIAKIPSLEVQFLLFNMNSKVLSDSQKRKVVSLAVDQKGFSDVLGEYANPINQFISNGIFGFNPYVSDHRYDLEEARVLAEQVGLKGKTLLLHLPKDLVILGEHVRKQLNSIDIFVIVSYLEPQDFLASLLEGKADIYFMGFRSMIGDSANFIDVLVDGGSGFAVPGYSNPKVEDLIQKSSIEFDPSVRVQQLQEIMRILVEEDVSGVPLFEYETLYSFIDKFDFNPRIDGFIYFDELNLK
jgi:peptide/nickel transport system substrate-binding protein